MAGLNATSMSKATLGLGGSSVNGSRILYYQDGQASIMELNNTDFKTKDGRSEGWVNNATSVSVSGSSSVNTGVSMTSSTGLKVNSNAMLGSRLSMTSGWRGQVNELWQFCQTNGSDVTYRWRNRDEIGKWSEPAAIDVSAPE